MRTRQAGCGCGALSVRTEGAPVRNSICHCLGCRCRTGTPSSWNATFAEEQVAMEGEQVSFAHASDDGFSGSPSFPPRCGTRIFDAIERRRGMVSLPAGLFRDPPLPAHMVETYEERRCARLAPLTGP